MMIGKVKTFGYKKFISGDYITTHRKSSKGVNTTKYVYVCVRVFVNKRKKVF